MSRKNHSNKRAFEKELAVDEPLRLTVGEALFFEASPQQIGALDDRLGEKRSDAHRGRIDSLLTMPEEIKPSHLSPWAGAGAFGAPVQGSEAITRTAR